MTDGCCFVPIGFVFGTLYPSGKRVLLLSGAHASPSAPRCGPFRHIVPSLLSTSPPCSTALPSLNPSFSLGDASVSLKDKKPTHPGPNLTTPSPSPHAQALEEEVTTHSWFLLSVRLLCFHNWGSYSSLFLLIYSEVKNWLMDFSSSRKSRIFSFKSSDPRKSSYNI